MALCLAGAREWKKIEKKDATGGGPSSEKRIIVVIVVSTYIKCQLGVMLVVPLLN